MTSTEQVAPTSYGLLRAAEAVTNWRALAMTGLAGLVFFLFIALSSWLMKSSVVLGGLFGIVSLVVGLIGYSSVGITLMRRAQGQEASFTDAILQAVFTVHRLLGVGVLLFLGFLGVVLAALLVLFICKIPGLGVFLYSFALPILAVVLGMTIAGMFYVGFPLAAPAVWEGNTAFQTVARLVVIVRHRLLAVITNLVILSLLVMFLSGVVSFVLFSGYSTSMGLSSAVGISPLGGIASLFRGVTGGMMYGPMGMGGMGGMESSTSYTGAFGFATGLLLTIGLTIPFLTFINGTCLIYLQTVDGLNFGETEEKMREHVVEAKRRTQEARDRAGSKLQEARSSVQASSKQGSTVVAGRACLKCSAPLAPDDMFCGECGVQNPV
ncbi:zinc ribbon domain-containing protein [Collimonas antrihumi]|uniref:zinc ribbon domain-containing protein n=1 Tax=Collimonas antrihumi TaxID=1940615 RepID=UPI001B8CB659|nr:zinc ribbon domain-containing protein [Collimonas antrihumi]